MENIETKTIRIKLRDIRKNPFRNFDRYPYSEVKIKALIESIKKTGFWENLSGRQDKDGTVEISFGHHRLEALKRLFGEDHEIDILVLDLDDKLMLRRMGLENDEAYDCPLAATDDLVSSTRGYLEAHPEEARALLSSPTGEVKRVRIGSRMIAKFLNKPVGTVEKSTERLRLIEKGLVNPAALYLMPSSAAADLFMKNAKGMNFDEQLTRATGIEQSGRFGESSISDMMKREIPIFKNEKDPRIEHAEYCDTHLRQCTKFMTSALRELDRVLEGFNNKGFFLNEISSADISATTKNDFNSIMMKLAEKIQEVKKKLDPN
jgi:hypothetical protein